MDKNRAINLLVTFACCAAHGLRCDECPAYDEENEDEDGIVGCKSWEEKEIAEAVRFLRKEGMV